MTVYVDDMSASYGRMKMCHMIADTEEELHAMADKIGVQRKWYQGPPKTRHKHYDIALSKKELAVKYGAVEITQKQTVCILWCLARGIAFSSPEMFGVEAILMCWGQEHSGYGFQEAGDWKWVVVGTDEWVARALSNGFFKE